MDRQLVERAQRGDREAFASIVHELSDPLFGLAYRILREHALARMQSKPRCSSRGAIFAASATSTVSMPGSGGSSVNACYRESRERSRWQANVRVLPIEMPTAVRDDEAVVDRDLLERSFVRPRHLGRTQR